MATYFQKTFRPDIINGDVSTVIQSNKTDLPFGSNDLLFDWHALDIPRGVDGIVDLHAHSYGEDGGTQSNTDLSFIFAKSVDNVAPTTLGEENAAQTACFELPLHYLGAVKIEGTGSPIVGPAFGDAFSTGYEGGNNGYTCNLVLEGDPDSGQNVGYDVIYVACFTKAALDFSTGVLSTGAISADAQTTIAVDTVDARKSFVKGDKVYVHDVDTLCGTVSSVASGVITLEANNAVAIANNDEIMNGSPMKISFGFQN